MKRILIYSQSTIAKDPRVYKQVVRLSRDYEVVTIGYGTLNLANVKCLDIQSGEIQQQIKGLFNKILNAISEKRLAYVIVFHISRVLPAWFPFKRTKIKDFLIINGKNSRTVRNVLKEEPIDLIIANDFTGLPVCAAAAATMKVKLLYDAHEYTVGQSNHDSKWAKERLPYIRYALNKYLHKCERVTTVCDSIAKEYQITFGIPLPTVIKNAAPYNDLLPQDIHGDKIKLVHHGLALRQRAIEDMIKVVELLDSRYELYLYLVFKDMEYFSELKKMAAVSGRVFFMEPVPLAQITSTLNLYDIGLYILPPTNFNQLNALPNKLFEFIQARLAIAIAPSPEMSALVEKYELGVIAGDFSPESMAKVISSLDDEAIQRYKQNSHSCAKDLSAELEMEKFVGIVEDLVNSK